MQNTPPIDKKTNTYTKLYDSILHRKTCASIGTINQMFVNVKSLGNKSEENGLDNK